LPDRLAPANLRSCCNATQSVAAHPRRSFVSRAIFLERKFLVVNFMAGDKPGAGDMEAMERRSFLKFLIGSVSVAAAAITTSAITATPSEAMPVMPRPPQPTPAEPAVATQDDIDAIKPEPVQYYWRRRRYWRWRRRRYRYWRRRRFVVRRGYVGWRRRRYRYWRRRRYYY
jgi:hypothetical protein